MYIERAKKRGKNGPQSNDKAVVKASLHGEVNSNIKTGEGISSIKPLLICRCPLTEKV